MTETPLRSHLDPQGLGIVGQQPLPPQRLPRVSAVSRPGPPSGPPPPLSPPLPPQEGTAGAGPGRGFPLTAGESTGRDPPRAPRPGPQSPHPPPLGHHLGGTVGPSPAPPVAPVPPSRLTSYPDRSFPKEPLGAAPYPEVSKRGVPGMAMAGFWGSSQGRASPETLMWHSTPWHRHATPLEGHECPRDRLGSHTLLGGGREGRQPPIHSS